jgi:hypothetical protein
MRVKGTHKNLLSNIICNLHLSPLITRVSTRVFFSLFNSIKGTVAQESVAQHYLTYASFLSYPLSLEHVCLAGARVRCFPAFLLHLRYSGTRICCATTFSEVCISLLFHPSSLHMCVYQGFLFTFLLQERDSGTRICCATLSDICIFLLLSSIAVTCVSTRGESAVFFYSIKGTVAQESVAKYYLTPASITSLILHLCTVYTCVYQGRVLS